MITVYGRADSSNVQTVMWGLGELGLTAAPGVRRLDYGHRFGGNDQPEFLAMNPHGRVPVLQDGSLILWESCAILRYLAARYGDGGAFWPADPAARARIDMWAEWGKGTLVAAFSQPIFWARYRTPAARRDVAALTAALARFEGLLDLLEAQIGDAPWLCGPEFTLADIAAGHIFYRWFTLDVPRRPRPGVEGWYARLAARPAFADHVMIPYEALKAEGA